MATNLEFCSWQCILSIFNILKILEIYVAAQLRGHQSHVSLRVSLSLVRGLQACKDSGHALAEKVPEQLWLPSLLTPY